jgi:glycine/D-amino acid oxidase-like deaminating enzyme
MKKTQASTTAQGIAFARALESSKPPGDRICDDPLARRLINPVFFLLGKLFAGYAERKGTGVSGFPPDFMQPAGVMGVNHNLHHGLGHAGHGLKLTSLFGKVIADL